MGRVRAVIDAVLNGAVITEKGWHAEAVAEAVANAICLPREVGAACAFAHTRDVHVFVRMDVGRRAAVRADLLVCVLVVRAERAWTCEIAAVGAVVARFAGAEAKRARAIHRAVRGTVVLLPRPEVTRHDLGVRGVRRFGLLSLKGVTPIREHHFPRV